MAVGLGLEPRCPFLDARLAGVCNNRSANLPFGATKRNRTLSSSLPGRRAAITPLVAWSGTWESNPDLTQLLRLPHMPFLLVPDGPQRETRTHTVQGLNLLPLHWASWGWRRCKESNPTRRFWRPPYAQRPPAQKTLTSETHLPVFFS